MSGIIYAWWCDKKACGQMIGCGRKGATNEPPIGNALVCFQCGKPLRIETFSDIFLTFRS